MHEVDFEMERWPRAGLGAGPPPISSSLLTRYLNTRSNSARWCGFVPLFG